MESIENDTKWTNRINKVVNFFGQILYPIGVDGKLTKWFLTFFISQWSVLLVIASFSLSITTTTGHLTYLSAIFIQVFRHVVYLILLVHFREKVKLLIERITKERKLVQTSDINWSLTIDYSRNEFVAAVFGFIGICSFLVLLLFGVFLFEYNEYNLPYRFQFIFLPTDEFLSLNWHINYFFQFTFINITMLLYYAYTGYNLVLINYSCWEIDSLRLQVAELFRNDVSLEQHDEEIRKTILKSYQVMDWLNESREVLRLSFLADFSLASFIFCLCLYALSSDVFESATTLIIICALSSQLSLFCWMGNRVNVRIEQLATIYDVDWYTQNAKHRKDLLMILIMAQRLKGYNGIFNSVDLETLQKILQFTYSLFTLLKTTNEY